MREKGPPHLYQIKHERVFFPYGLSMSIPHLHSSDEGLCCSHSLWSVPYLVEQSPSKQLQDIWAFSVREVPWGNPPAHLILPLSIYQLAAAYKAVNSSLLSTWCSFIGSPFHGAAPIFNISYFSFWVQLFGKAAFFFKLYVWIKSGTVAFWAMEKTDPLIIREFSSSSLLCLAVWKNVTPKEWKCSHISIQIQDFSISNRAVDGKSQRFLFSQEEPFADKAFWHSVPTSLTSLILWWQPCGCHGFLCLCEILS